MTQGAEHSFLADVVGASLVAEQVAMTADARDISPDIASDGSGSRSGDQHNGRAVADSFESQIHVRADADQFAGKFLFE